MISLSEYSFCIEFVVHRKLRSRVYLAENSNIFVALIWGWDIRRKTKEPKRRKLRGGLGASCKE